MNEKRTPGSASLEDYIAEHEAELAAWRRVLGRLIGPPRSDGWFSGPLVTPAEWAQVERELANPSTRRLGLR